MFEATLIAVIFLIAYQVLRSSFSIAPYVPMDRRDLEKIHSLANLKKGERFCELGSGDGRVCLFISKSNPETEVIGIENVAILSLWSKIRKLFWKRKNLKFVCGDALKSDLSGSDVVYIYAIIPTISSHIKEKLEKELKKGSRVISYVFPVKGWENKLKKSVANERSGETYFYEV